MYGNQARNTQDQAHRHAAARLALHPMITAIGNGAAEIFVAPDFITRTGCDALIELIHRKRQPSTVADPNGDASFRTSETCHMDTVVPVVDGVVGSIAGLLGIHRRHAEPLQGQRYGVGGEFKPHTDTFRPGSADYHRHCRVAGQRTWTAMGYLNDVEEGGHTTFPLLGVDMRPRRGTLLLWNNLRPDGGINPATLHHATPVVRGSKSVVTLWFRERPWG